MTTITALQVCNRKHSHLLEILWSDQLRSVYSHKELRNHCRCAFCRSRAAHGLPVNASEQIALTGIALMGEYGIQLSFSDGHKRGIYPWVYLRGLSTAETDCA